MNQRIDAVATARLQVGMNPGGTKFWEHMGYKTRVEWCACFISWLMDAVKLAPEKWRRSGGCTQMMAYAGKIGIILSKDTEPQPGDIVFFEWNDPGDGPDHAGIISSVLSDSIYTIEGNVKDAAGVDNVVCRSWDRNDKRVYAIARPEYEAGKSWADVQDALARIITALEDIKEWSGDSERE